MNERERLWRSKRAKIVEDMRAILDKCEAEHRAMRADEQERYAAMDADLDGSERQIKLANEETGDELETRDLKNKLYGNSVYHEGPRFTDTSAVSFRDKRYENPEYRDAFRRYLREGVNAISHAEFRALQADIDTAGGFLVMPSQMVTSYIHKMDNLVFMRKLATVYQAPKAESLGVPALDNDPGDPTWTAEIGTGQEDSTMSFGKRELVPKPIARLIKVSNKLLRASYLDAEAIVIDRLSYKFSVVEEAAFLNGTGAGQPMGIFTPAAVGFGISTARDVSTGNTTSAVTCDGMIEAFFSLKAQYRKKATWILHRDVVKKIRKLKDGEGQYIWQLGLATGKPDTILGAPYCESEYAPDTFTNGAYVGIVGDFSNYWIVEALNMQIQRLIELYAATNQTGMIGRAELDGMPVLEEGFSRIQLAP